MLSSGYVIQQLVNALIIGSFYSLLAVSYALVHGLTNRIVLAFGDMTTVSAFAAIYSAIVALSLGFDTPLVLTIAFIGTIVCSGALGISSFNTLFAPLIKGKGQALLIASISLGLVLQEVMRLQSGGREQWLEPVLSGAVTEIAFGGFIVRVSMIQLLIIAGTALLLLSLLVLLRSTQLGRKWRACSEDAGLAQLIGIDVRAVVALTFVAASVYAGAAGFTLALYYGGVSFYMGLMLGLKALFASIIGGFGTVSGAVAGAFTLALLETLWATFFPLGYRDAAVFAIILTVLIIRPEGLMGVKQRKDYER
jgi:branched-chain amino acid transport system permease protein